MQMAERYAHMTYQRVTRVVGNIEGTWQTSGKLDAARDSEITWKPAPILVGLVGLEPTTKGL